MEITLSENKKENVSKFGIVFAYYQLYLCSQNVAASIYILSIHSAHPVLIGCTELMVAPYFSLLLTVAVVGEATVGEATVGGGGGDRQWCEKGCVSMAINALASISFFRPQAVFAHWLMTGNPSRNFSAFLYIFSFFLKIVDF